MPVIQSNLQHMMRRIEMRDLSSMQDLLSTGRRINNPGEVENVQLALRGYREAAAAQRAVNGAGQNMDLSMENARRIISDVDMAEISAEAQRLYARQQAGSSVLAQANDAGQAAVFVNGGGYAPASAATPADTTETTTAPETETVTIGEQSVTLNASQDSEGNTIYTGNVSVTVGNEALTFDVVKDSGGNISVSGSYDNLNDIDGLKNVSLSAEYKDGDLVLSGSGKVTVAGKDIDVDVTYSKNEGVTASGTFSGDLGGLKDVTLNVEYDKGEISAAGSGTATVAGQEVSFDVGYSSADGLSASGSMSFNALGQNVNLDVSYSQADGFSAAGTARVNVLGNTLNLDFNLTNTGEITATSKVNVAGTDIGLTFNYSQDSGLEVSGSGRVKIGGQYFNIDAQLDSSGVTLSGSSRLNIGGKYIDVSATYSSSGQLSVQGGTKLDIPGVGNVDIEVFMDGNTFGVRGSTSYYVKGVGYIDLNVGIDSNKEFYLEGSKGDAGIRISSMGDVKLTYGDMSVEVNKDFTVGISGGKVTAEARAGAAGSVNVNGVEVGVSAGGSLNAGVDRSGKITLGGGFNTKINVGGYELKFQGGGSVTLDAGGAVRDIGNMMVKLKDGTYKKLSGAMDSLFNAGGDLLSDINETLSNIFKPPKVKFKWGW